MRVFVERPDDAPSDAGPVGLPDCERVNERLSALLDLEDPIPGSYVLEVSTPGLDRPLHSISDCRRFTGRRVRVKCRMEDRHRTLVGKLETVEEFAVRIEGIVGEPEDAVWVRWDDVLAARLDPDFDALLGPRSHGGRKTRPGRRRRD